MGYIQTHDRCIIATRVMHFSAFIEQATLAYVCLTLPTTVADIEKCTTRNGNGMEKGKEKNGKKTKMEEHVST